tara:strand:- start:170 stop:331 length:162 start_codon:yes stop_codon:yes gene_type:complete
MPMGKGTYGSQVGRPSKTMGSARKKKKESKEGLTSKQKSLPKSLQMKILKKKS